MPGSPVVPGQSVQCRAHLPSPGSRCSAGLTCRPWAVGAVPGSPAVPGQQAGLQHHLSHGALYAQRPDVAGRPQTLRVTERRVRAQYVRLVVDRVVTRDGDNVRCHLVHVHLGTEAGGCGVWGQIK